MPIDIIALRAAHAAGATADVLIAIVEVQQRADDAQLEERRKKDAARQAARRKAGPITYEMRLAVYERDGWKCVYCDAAEPLTCDHVVAIKRGGLTTLENLATACGPCNSRKRDKELKQFKRDLARRGKSAGHPPDIRPTSADTPADPPSAVGPPSADPPGIESVDKTSPVSEQGLTKQGDSLLSSLLPSFDESSNSKEKKEVDTHAREATESLFEKFWAAYPNKVGKRDAANSFRRIMKLGIVGIDDLMAGLARYVAKTDDRPWCNPATWLNGGRWEDQPSLFNGGSNGQHQNGSNGSGGGHVGGFASYAIKHARLAAAARAEREKGQ